QSAVHGGEPLALFALRERARCPRRLRGAVTPPPQIATGRQAIRGKCSKPSPSWELAWRCPEMPSYSSPDRFIIVGAVALAFNRLRAYCNCVSFSGSFGTYD